MNSQRYAPYLLDNNFGELQKLSDGQRPSALRALANLSKFLGCYEEFQRQRKAFGLSWGGRCPDDIIIDRLTKTQSPDEMIDWMRNAKALRSDFSGFIDFLVATGLRCGESVNSYNLIIELAKEGTLYSNYLNVETKMLDHFRFTHIFLKNSKKAFVNYAPDNLIEAIEERELLTSVDSVIKKVDNEGLKLRFSDIREFHASYLTKYLGSNEIDFLHGRVNATVFMAHYYNPKFVKDLITRLAKRTSEILARFLGGGVARDR